ncbi:MAG: aminopeptidase P family protein [Candidatus Pristimantibacillus lignocellulolyticus]|uniref:Aminopeptidase P family protein n=1 Tax=Candidatus Pristimantibacillus lignocellulolyticus TaxID=2994561 RepID=A0A9J6ZCI7_9BACL|nr:MAG: aminopeptidase P family protein [Candidatus Pristimantibacillus lignocellulolyticus]
MRLIKSIDAQELAIVACQNSKQYLKPGISEKEFADKCEEIMRSLGAESLWYPMLVNFNENTIFCTRGDHLPSEEVYLKVNDIVLVDYSPMLNGMWGDYSETILVGKNEEFQKLIEDAKQIFELTYEFSNKVNTVGELFEFCTELIEHKGYTLLDPNGNIGHTIENFSNHDKRIYIYPENNDLSLKGKKWAIEPHIGKNGYGAKFENVIVL